ncbi:MAG: sugar transferase [Actinomycetota bacterium]
MPVDLTYPGKRVIDGLLLAVVAVPAAILSAVVALLVRCTSRGPVLFRQTRVGHLGHPFTILKFRTMGHNPDGNAIVPDADQITAVGRVLRRLSLDELPQLWNVARGEMSVVGPRPTLEYQVQRYDDRQRTRLSVRPGLTGLAQVEGRNTLAWADRIELDLEYVDRNSPTLDLTLAVRTVPALLRGTGVGGHDPADPLAAPDEEPTR